MKHNGEHRNSSTQVWPTGFWQWCKRNSVEEGQSFQQTVLEQLDIQIPIDKKEKRKINFHLNLTPHEKLTQNGP